MPQYTTDGSGTNSDGNHWCSRDYGDNVPNPNSYHYSNQDGSYYYSNPDGSQYYNSGDGFAKYTPPSGSGSGDGNSTNNSTDNSGSGSNK